MKEEFPKETILGILFKNNGVLGIQTQSNESSILDHRLYFLMKLNKEVLKTLIMIFSAQKKIKTLIITITTLASMSAKNPKTIFIAM